MIERLLVVPHENDFAVICPKTKMILSTSVDRTMACDWALGFMETYNFMMCGVKPTSTDQKKIGYYFGSHHANNEITKYRQQNVQLG